MYYMLVLIYMLEIFPTHALPKQCAGETFDRTPILSTNIPSEASPAVSAVLLDCPREYNVDPDVPGAPVKPHKAKFICEKQLMVNIRVCPSFRIEHCEKFLVLDEVYDPQKRTRAKIMSPYLIEISRGEPIMMYPLDFTKNVNCPPKTDAQKNQTDGMAKHSSKQRDTGNGIQIKNQDKAQIVDATANIEEHSKQNEELPEAADLEMCKKLELEEPQILSTKCETEETPKCCCTDRKETNEPTFRDGETKNENVPDIQNGENVWPLFYKNANLGGKKYTANYRNLYQTARQLRRPTAGQQRSVYKARQKSYKSVPIYGDAIEHGEAPKLRKTIPKMNLDWQNKYKLENDNKHYAEFQSKAKRFKNKANLVEEVAPGQFDAYLNDYKALSVPRKKLPLDDKKRTREYMDDWKDSDDEEYNEIGTDDDIWNDEVYSKDDKDIMPKGLNYDRSFADDRKSLVPGVNEKVFNSQQQYGTKLSSSQAIVTNPQFKTENLLPKRTNMPIVEYPEDDNDPVYKPRNFDYDIQKQNFVGGRRLENEFNLPLARQTTGSVYNYPPAKFTEAANSQKMSAMKQQQLHQYAPNRFEKQFRKFNEGNMPLVKAYAKVPLQSSPNVILSKNYGLMPIKVKEHVRIKTGSVKYYPEAPEAVNMRYNYRRNPFIRDRGQQRDRKSYTHLRLHKHPASSEPHSKQKRSYVFYDDLEARDTVFDNDYNFDKPCMSYSRIPSPSRTMEEEDVAPCQSCGGKKKKPPGSSDPSSIKSRENTNCGCRGGNARLNCECTRARHIRRSSKKVPPEKWFSVFNMSTPVSFLTTKLRIFRKRYNTWWRIMPSITLNSLTGIFTNANMSMIFSSHVDIFQVEKSMRLLNHRLVIPNENQTLPCLKPNPLSNEEPIYGNEDSEHSAIHFNNLQSSANKLFSTDADAIEFKAAPSHKVARGSGNIFNLNTFPMNYFFQPKSYNKDKRSVPNENNANANIKESFKHQNNILTIWPHVDKNWMPNREPRAARTFADDGSIHTLGEFGYFPTSMNLLERCPYDKSRLCLNIIEDRVPAYSIKLKMPFRENAAITPNHMKAKIARVVADATTKDVVQVFVEIINMGFATREFSVCMCDCVGLGCAVSSKNIVEKTFYPHISETVTFLLPFLTDDDKKAGHHKATCNVVVKSVSANKDPADPKLLLADNPKPANNNHIFKRLSFNKTKDERVIAVRKVKIEESRRCLCVWKCDCHCIGNLAEYDLPNMCKKSSFKDIKNAGLLLGCSVNEKGLEVCITDDDYDKVEEKDEQQDPLCKLVIISLLVIAVMLLLGLTKALLGRYVSDKINRFGYDAIQPNHIYDCSSKYRRFFINIVFFIVFPFLFWFNCFNRRKKNVYPIASQEWHCPSSDDSMEQCSEKSSKLSLRSSCCGKKTSKTRTSGRSSQPRLSGGFDRDESISEWAMALNADDFSLDYDDDTDEENNTKFVLQALVESRESLQKLLHGHSSNEINQLLKDEPERRRDADELVDKLKRARIVYRTFSQTIGNVRCIPPNKKYSIQGYFLPCVGPGYEFINYNPLVQHRCFSASGENIHAVTPPAILCPKEFSRFYECKLDVLDAGDLSVAAPDDAPCINVAETYNGTELHEHYSESCIEFHAFKRTPKSVCSDEGSVGFIEHHSC